MLIDALELCALLVCFYQLFGLVLTAPIHCRGAIWWVKDEMLNFFTCSKKKKKNSGRVDFQLTFIFGWPIPLFLLKSQWQKSLMIQNSLCKKLFNLRSIMTFLWDQVWAKWTVMFTLYFYCTDKTKVNQSNSHSSHSFSLMRAWLHACINGLASKAAVPPSHVWLRLLLALTKTVLLIFTQHA